MKGLVFAFFDADTGSDFLDIVVVCGGGGGGGGGGEVVWGKRLERKLHFFSPFCMVNVDSEADKDIL